MKLKLTNIDEICKDLPEITNHKIFESGKFSKTGLFSQQIFGPVKSFCCACNRITYRGRSNNVSRCEICDVDIVPSEERRKRFAKIELPFKILNPIFFYILTSSRPAMKKIFLNLLNYKAEYFFDSDDKLLKAEKIEVVDENTGEIKEEYPENIEVLKGLSGVIKIIENTSKNDPRPEFKFIKNHFKESTIRNILIIPPDFRPCGNSASGTKIVDEINQLYSRLIIQSNHVRDILFKIDEDNDIFQMNFRHIQSTVLELYNFVLARMSKKKGLIRSNILGKRVDFSGRAVISPNPDLSLDECKIPYVMLLEILKPQLSAYFVNRRICKRYSQAVILIEKCIKDQSDDFYELAEEFCEGKFCILNRQPTLHRMGVLGFKVGIHKGNTIQIHPLVCSAYNADFDGDAMAVYFPVTKEAEEDVDKKIGIWNNLISPTDITSVPQPNQDIILGIYTVTNDENYDTEKEYEKDGKKLSFGKYLFNSCMPEDYPVIKNTITKNKLSVIINDLVLRYPAKVVIKCLDKIKTLGFVKSSIEGYSLGVNDLFNEEMKKISGELTGNIREDLTLLNSNETKNRLKQFKFHEFIDSGARGSWEQARQLVLSRGYVSDVTGRIVPELIRNSLTQGLNQGEFFISSYGARKGLLDTALSTGDSGYLTRQLIYSTVAVRLDDSPEGDDCGSKDYLTIKIKDKRMAKTLLWRYYSDSSHNLHKVTIQNYQSLIGKTIRFRSPIYCKNKKICRKCYGDLHKILHSNEIGIIATQAVGERITQLVLRTFHLSGVAQLGRKSERQEDIIGGIERANKLFHNPKDLNRSDGEGKIVTAAHLTTEIYNLFNPYKGIHSVHYEVIVSVMMWSGDKLWRLNKNRDFETYEWTSILQIPHKTSWLLGCAFSNLKAKLLDGLVKNKEDQENCISDLFKF